MHNLIGIIDRAYNAALDSATWPTVVHALQNEFGCTSAGIYNVNRRDGAVSVVHLSDIDGDYVRRYVDRYLFDNPWTRVEKLQRPGVIRTDRSLDEYHNRPGFYRNTAFFNEWMKPQDFIYSMSTILCADRHLVSKLYLYRSGRTAPFTDTDADRLALLSRHLINAVRVARSLGSAASRSEERLDLFERLSFGVLILDRRGLLLEANAFARRLLRARDGLRTERGEVVATHNADAARLAATVAAALALRDHQSPDAPSAIRLHRRSQRQRLSALAVPLPARSDSPFVANRAAVALIVTNPEQRLDAPVESLRARYELTNAEARLARHLLGGATLRESAELAGIGYETARSHLRNVFQKTGTSRQSDLVRILISDQVDSLLTVA